MVQIKGLEPLCLKTVDFESTVYAIPPYLYYGDKENRTPICYLQNRHFPIKLYPQWLQSEGIEPSLY